MIKVKVFFDNRRGIRVTEQVFSTRLRDEQLSAIVSLKVGREPLFIAGPVGFALIVFALQFDGWLTAGEQVGLMFAGALLIACGYAIASLTVGTLFNEKAVFWHTIWTVQQVRRAIRDAMHVRSMGKQTAPLPKRPRGRPPKTG